MSGLTPQWGITQCAARLSPLPAPQEFGSWAFARAAIALALSGAGMTQGCRDVCAMLVVIWGPLGTRVLQQGVLEVQLGHHRWPYRTGSSCRGELLGSQMLCMQQGAAHRRIPDAERVPQCFAELGPRLVKSRLYPLVGFWGKVVWIGGSAPPHLAHPSSGWAQECCAGFAGFRSHASFQSQNNPNRGMHDIIESNFNCASKQRLEKKWCCIIFSARAGSQH